MAIIINKKGLSSVIHLTANATITIAGATGTSDIAVGDEVLTGCSIKQIWYGSNNGHWETAASIGRFAAIRDWSLVWALIFKKYDQQKENKDKRN